MNDEQLNQLNAQHALSCALWTSSSPDDGCNCDADEPVNLADAPTMRAAIEQAYGGEAA